MPKPTRVKRQVDEDKSRQIDVNLANIKCQFDSSLMTDNCSYTIQQEVKPGETYNITLCAGNEFGITCQSSEKTIQFEPPPKTAPIDGVETDSGLPLSTILGIVIGVLVAILLFCLLLICLAFFSATALLARKKDFKVKDMDQKDDERFTKL